MKRLLLVFTLLATVISGCSQNHFNVPTENFADKVRVLGIAPIIVDADSDIKHPQKAQLISLLTEMNRKYEQQFARKLKDTGNFYTVALLDGDPQNIFAKLTSRREKRDDATIMYNKYFWKNDDLRDYILKNNLDAVMLIIVSGLTKSDKVMSIGQLKSLTTDFNYLVMTAQILDANGTILWEYPNFRQTPLSYDPIINLEYPDFNEAEANLTTSTNVKFKTIEGIRRIFDQKQKDLLMRDTQEPEVYGKQFDAMVSLLKYDHDKDKKATVPVIETPRPQQPAATAPSAPAATPSNVPTPSVEVPAITRVPVLEKSDAATDEIVPAKGSTL
jgi:hypothetical protein